MNAARQADKLPRSPAGDYNPWMVAVMLSIAPFMEVLDTTIANVSLTHIAGSLAASQTESTWILTSYLVSNGIILPISGWLANMIGRKRFYQLCVLLFTAASVLCAFSTSLDMIIVARIIQGLGGGGLAPATQSMLADSFPQEKRGQVFALFGFTIVAAPATGPVIGGWITDHISWHWIFLINLPIGLLAMTLIAIFVTEPPLLIKERAEMLASGLRLDYFGLFLVAIGFGALQIFLDKFELDDGFSSPFIVALFAITLVALSTLLVWEWQHPQPVMNIRLFKLRNFTICAIVTFFVGFLLLSSTQLMPQLAQTLLGYDAETSGLAMALGGIVTITMMPLAGFLTGRILSPRVMMLIAFVELSFAMFSDSQLTPQIGFNTLAVARIVQVVALPFLFVPISAASYLDLPPRYNGEAAAVMNLMRNVGGGVGISFMNTMLAWRTQFHHARLVESITPYSSLHGLAVSQIAMMVQQQASFISYLDLFRIVGFLSLAVLPVVLFLKSPEKRVA